MPLSSAWTGAQYSLYRVLLALYLIIHFGMLLPYAGEVFGAGGAVASAQLSPYFGLLPNLLAWSDSSAAVTTLMLSAMLAAALLMIGWSDRAAALWCALVLAGLYARNPLIANPSLPLLGWMLIAHLFAPARPFGSVAAMRAGGANPDWRLPMSIYVAAFVVLAVSYSYSGYTKLLSPGWVSGTAISEVLQNPLARDNWLTSLMLALPPLFLKTLTWTVLMVELLFAPLCLWSRARPWMWLIMLLVQFGFLLCLDFADLTAPMLLAHLLTFNPRWLDRWVDQRPALLLFDGHCAFCHASVRFAAMEDRSGALRYATLAGPHGQGADTGAHPALGDTIVLIDADGKSHLRAAAVAGVLKRLGGLWYLLGLIWSVVPRFVGDRAYDLVGRIRYRLAGRTAVDACPLLPAQIAARMLR
jgi:predicted DCC family thiol-disulfide oxidoreductase YuxK